MSEEEKRDKLDNYDLEHAIIKTKNYFGVSNGNNGSFTWQEVTDEEYENIGVLQNRAADYYETAGKKLKLVALQHEEIWDVYLHVFWKLLPNTRSFDVIGLRFQNFARLENCEYGHQFYRPAGNEHFSSISYDANGTNIKKQFDGFGISMNLVNQNITGLELEVGADGIISAENPYIFGSYQHAVNNVSLAESQNYNISPAGYGNVFNFSQSVMTNYDGMQGVHFRVQ